MSNSLYPCLWYDNKAKEATDFYCGIFKNSKITYESPMLVRFELNDQQFMALNGGPLFKFNESVSFVVECEDQAEIDHYWSKLTSDGGKESQCGWLKDKYGVSWQIVPKILAKLMTDKDRAPRVVQAFLKMKKFDIETLLKA